MLSGVIKHKKWIITAVILAGLMVLTLVINARETESYTMYNSSTITYRHGRVVEVTSESLESAPNMPGWQLGAQELIVEFTEKEWEGQQVHLTNSLSTAHNIYVKVGQRVIVKADCPENVEPYYTLYNYDRTGGLIAVGLLFAAMMALVGLGKGIKSVLGLGISVFFILCFLLPAIYRGWSPIIMTAVTVILIAIFSMLLLNGFRRKTVVAIAATAAGVALSALFFAVISALLNLSGYHIPEAEELILISQHTGLQISQVLFSSVLIASLGAVMDTTMSIAASLYEMRQVHPEVTKKALFRSGLVIGRDMIGTMCQTLVLAFVGGAIASLLVMFAYGTRADQLLSSDYVAIEVAQAVSGSIAVIMSVPVTAGLCALDIS